MGSKNQNEVSIIENGREYLHYINELEELSISNFEWLNMPSSIDTVFLERMLFEKGSCLFFVDDVVGALSLDYASCGTLNVYDIPTKRSVIANNGYTNLLTDKNSVIIFNNMLRNNSYNDVELFAKKLYLFDRIISVNVNAQKTPILIKGKKTQRLSLLEMYKEFDGNNPAIFCDDNFDTNALSVLKTDAPYISDKLYELKSKYWNECLTYLGVSNTNDSKKERLISNEVDRNMGGVFSCRNSRLNARKQACKQINEMFGLNIDVRFRETDIKGGTDNE